MSKYGVPTRCRFYANLFYIDFCQNMLSSTHSMFHVDDFFLFSTRPSPGLLLVLGPLEVLQTPHTYQALPCGSWADFNIWSRNNSTSKYKQFLTLTVCFFYLGKTINELKLQLNARQSSTTKLQLISVTYITQYKCVLLLKITIQLQ